MDSESGCTRRAFLGGAGLGALTLAIFGVSRRAGADGVPPPAGKKAVSPKDPVAAGLRYVEDATKVDPKKNPRFQAGQSCAGCAFYTKRNEGWGACALLSTGVVAANGWCSSFAPKSAK